MRDSTAALGGCGSAVGMGAKKRRNIRRFENQGKAHSLWVCAQDSRNFWNFPTMGDWLLLWRGQTT